MKRYCFAAFRSAILLLATAFTFDNLANGARAVEVRVEAGSLNRQNVPVCATANDKSTFPAKLTDVVSADGELVPAQVTKPSLLAAADTEAELHFVDPELKAGASQNFKIASHEREHTNFRWEEHPGESIDLFYGDRPVLSYVCKPLDLSSPEAREATFKPFHHVFDPLTGKTLLTKGPGGLFTHHRGLFYGFNKVTYGDNQHCDVWHCPPKEGSYQQHEKIISSEAGPVLARQRLAIGWHGLKGELFANEQRELTIYNVAGGLLIDFASRVAPLEGKMKLDGDPQHAGFHFRATNEVAMQTESGQSDAVKRKEIEKGTLKPDPQTYYLRADGKGVLGETRNWEPKAKKPDPKTINLPWNAMSMVVGGQRYTVEYMDSPKNPKEARYSERDYGRFGSYFTAEATPDKPLEVRYRLWIQPGEMTVEQAAAKDANFDEPAKVVVK